MLLLAELISYPYNLRQVSPDSLIPLFIDPAARKVLDAVIAMKNNDEERESIFLAYTTIHIIPSLFRM